MSLGQEGWTRRFTEAGALWIRNGKSRARHVRLTSGLHSDGFFNSSQLRTQTLFELTASAWCDLLENEGRGGVEALGHIDVVVGVPNGAMYLARALAGEVSRRRGRVCSWGRLLKHKKGYKKRVIFAEPPNRRVITPGKRVLLCEDAITTGDSVERVCRAVEERGATVLPYVLSVVNRSNVLIKKGKKVLCLAPLHLDTWWPRECPLCEEGSEVVTVNGDESWRRLISVP